MIIVIGLTEPSYEWLYSIYFYYSIINNMHLNMQLLHAKSQL